MKLRSRKRVDVPDELVRVLWRLRFELLRVGTLYGLSAALVSPWTGAAESWRAWMDWLGPVGHAMDGAVGGKIEIVPSDLRPGTQLGQGNELLGMLVEGSAKGSGAASENPFAMGVCDWGESLELIEELSRRAEQFGVMPMGERDINRRGVDLLGVIEDSLVLLAYGAHEDHASLASSLEVYTLLRAARDDRAWVRLDPYGQTVMPAGTEFATASLEDVKRETLALLTQALEAIGIYDALRPDGRVLAGKERDNALSCLRANALASRALSRVPPDTEIPTPNGQADTNLRSVMARVRRVNRSLVLALSDQPARRSLAASIAELRPPT